MKQYIQNFDKKILYFFQNAKKPKWLDFFFIFLTKMGDYGLVWFLLAIFFAVQTEHIGDEEMIIAFNLAFALISVMLLSETILKSIIRRPRPFQRYPDITVDITKPKSFSFPSGHTALSWASVTILSLSFVIEIFNSIPLLILAIILAIGISFSRIYLRVHYASDVIVGLIVGSCIGFLSQYCGMFILFLLT